MKGWVSNMNKKITKRERFEQLLALEGVKANAELVAFIEHELELLAKKNSGEKKMTKAQEENEALKVLIVDVLDNSAQALTIGEIQAGDITATLTDLSNQKMSALLKQLVDTGAIERVADKKVTKFQIAGYLVKMTGEEEIIVEQE